jgi:DegV family protein with EDD domain
MKKYAIIFDSTVYLSQEVLDDNDVSVISLNVVDGVKSYRELDVDNQFIWDMQDKGTSWTTSQPAPGDFLEEYKKLIEKGYEKIFCVLLSKNISGTFQSATLAKNMLDNPEKVHIFDTMLAAYATAMIGLELIDMINDDKTAEEIIERITRIIGTSGQMFSVENLFSLVKGGRLSVTKAAIGTVLRLKPIVVLIDGKLELVKSERTYKKIHNYYVDSVKKSLEGRKTTTFYVMSQNSTQSATMAKEFLLENFPGSKLIYREGLGPVFSIHVGKKGYGISWFSE